MSSNRTEDFPLVEGSIAGLVAWLFGYVFTYAIVASDIRDSGLNRFIEAFEGEPATYEMVGWVFYNAHFVDTVYRDLPLLGNRSTSAIGGDGGFSLVLYAIPVGLLLAAGVALSRYQRPKSATRGALVGVTALPAYLLLSLVGVFLFEVSLGGATGSPDLVPALFVAGIAYPVLFAGGGGALGVLLEREFGDG